MAILKYLHLWASSVEMTHSFLLERHAHKTNCGLGEEGRWKSILIALVCKINYHNHRFKSNYFKSGKGFQLRYESTTSEPQMTCRRGMCGGNFTTKNGVFTSPAYPENYPINADCIYNIKLPIGNYILLNFSCLDIKCHDHLEIRDGPTDVSYIKHELCGKNVPSVVISTTNQVWLRW